MTPKNATRIKKIAGYTGVYLAAFFLFLYLTFPYATVREIVESRAQSAGLIVKIGSLGPGLFGPTAKRIKVALPAQGVDDPPGVMIDSVTVRPMLWPLGVHVAASLFGGRATSSFGLFKKKPPVSLDLKGLDLARADLKDAFGPDVKGVLGASAQFDVDSVDPSKSVGHIDLDIRDTVVSGNLPKINFGEIDAAFKLESGKALIDHFSVSGEDIEGDAEGAITLNPRLLYSTPQATAKFKLKGESDFIKTAKMMLFQGFNTREDSRGYYKLIVDGGALGNPRWHFQAN